jgi:hypothetical protein
MLIVEALVVAASYAVGFRGSGTDMIRFYSNANHVIVLDRPPLHAQIFFSDDTEHVVAKDLGSVPQVSHVFTHVVETSVLVWIALDVLSANVRHHIYDKELSLISEFPETEFDFNLIPRLGRRAEELIHGEARLVYDRDSIASAVKK